VIPAEGLLGALMDIFGRRKLIGVGTAFVGLSLILMTRFTSVYPALLIVYIMFAVANIPAYSAPLINDYLKPNSFGVNAAWSSLFSFLS
jgi:MFS family permease